MLFCSVLHLNSIALELKIAHTNILPYQNENITEAIKQHLAHSSRASFVLWWCHFTVSFYTSVNAYHEESAFINLWLMLNIFT